MLKRQLLVPITLVLALVSVIGFATPVFADSIPLYFIFQGSISTNPFGSGFVASFLGQARGVSGLLFFQGSGPTMLPTCPNPCVAGALFNPSVVLTFFGFSGAFDLVGKPFKIPAGSNPTIVRHVNVTGQLTGPQFGLFFPRGYALNVVPHFSDSGNLTLQSLTYFVVPEPGTLALFGTGLALIGCLRTSRLKFFRWKP